MTVVPRSWLPPRPRDSHKNDFGHVLVVGGAPGMSGAPRLAAVGALRGGAGLVTLAVPRSLEVIAAVGGPWEALTLALPESGGAVSAAAWPVVAAYARRRPLTALVVGPGLSVTAGSAAFVRRALAGPGLPVVLDADGLNALAGDKKYRPAVPVVATPHPGEAARLLGISAAAVQKDRPAAGRTLARRLGGVCVLKGHRTVISDGNRCVVNPTGNPAMATGGAGDVLAGLIAALIGQVAGPTPAERLWRAAVLGARLHGLAGDRAARRGGPITAGDLAEEIPAAFRRTFWVAV